MKPTTDSCFASRFVSRSASRWAVCAPLVAMLAACASANGAAPQPSAPSAPADASSASAATTPSPAADAVPARPVRPLDLTNECPHEMHVYYGETPGDGKGQAATIPPAAIVQVPRGADGTTAVWVTDDQGQGLASVHITKNMRHVRIDTTCSRIDADSKR